MESMMTEKKKKSRKKSKKAEFYNAKVGCWNCDTPSTVEFPKGITVPDYLMSFEPICLACGCKSLKPYLEWKIEKDIMKDLVLHHRVEQMSHEHGTDVKNDHHHIG